MTLAVIVLCAQPGWAAVVEQLSVKAPVDATFTEATLGVDGYVAHQGKLYFRAQDAFYVTDGDAVTSIWGQVNQSECRLLLGATNDNVYFACLSGSANAPSAGLYDPLSVPRVPFVPGNPANDYAGEVKVYRASGTGSLSLSQPSITGWLLGRLFASPTRMWLRMFRGNFSGNDTASVVVSEHTATSNNVWVRNVSGMALSSCQLGAASLNYYSAGPLFVGEGEHSSGSTLLWQGSLSAAYASTGCTPVSNTTTWTLFRRTNTSSNFTQLSAPTTSELPDIRGVNRGTNYYLVARNAANTAYAVRVYNGLSLVDGAEFSLGTSQPSGQLHNSAAGGLYLANYGTLYRLNEAAAGLSFATVKAFSNPVRILGDTANGLLVKTYTVQAGVTVDELWSVPYNNPAAVAKIASLSNVGSDGVVEGGRVWFSARAAAGAPVEPWVSDGSPAGTFSVATAGGALRYRDPAHFAAVGGKVVFRGCKFDGVSCPPATLVVKGAQDTTPPTITASESGVKGNGGWYRGDVVLSFSAEDNFGLLEVDGCDPKAVTTDTAGVTFTCSARSLGGAASKSVTVKRDTTPPSVTCPSDLELFAKTPTPVNFTKPVVVDALDAAPALTLTHASGSTFPIGTTQVVATATDAAGNSATCRFTVRLSVSASDEAPIGGGGGAAGGGGSGPIESPSASDGPSSPSAPRPGEVPSGSGAGDRKPDDYAQPEGGCGGCAGAPGQTPWLALGAAIGCARRRRAWRRG